VCRRNETAPARAAVQSIIETAIATTRGLPRLMDPHHILTAVRLAGTWPRIHHVVSITPREFIDARLIQAAEAADAEVLSHALGPHGQCLDARGWICASLPVSKGGLGIRHATGEALHAADQARALIGAAEGHPWPVAHLPATPERAHAKIFAKIAEHATPQEEAWLRGQADKHGIARHWLLTPAPRGQGSREKPLEISTAIAQRVLLPVYGAAIQYPGQQCPAHCAWRGICDPQGYHTLGCTATLTPRHNEIRDRIYRFLVNPLGRGNALRERHCAADGTPTPAQGARPGDVAYRAPGLPQWTFLDVGVRSITEDLVHAACAEPRVLARSIFDEKKRDVGRAVSATGAHYVPIALGANGTLDPRSLAELRKAASAVDQASDLSPPPGSLSVQRQLLARISAALAVGNARGVIETRSYLPELSNSLAVLSQEQTCALVLNSTTMRNQLLSDNDARVITAATAA
jgi:hypothetical protein